MQGLRDRRSQGIVQEGELTGLSVGARRALETGANALWCAVHACPAVKTLRSYTFTYDSASRLAGMTRDGQPVAYYAYDANGNRTSATTPLGTIGGVYDAQDRLVSRGGSTYGYGAAGDLRFQATGSDTVRYQYDALGNLRSVKLTDGSVIEYVVDALNRRVARRLNGQITHRFLYGAGSLQVAELDESGAIRTHFVYGSRSAVPDYMVRGDTTFRLVTDHLGSVRIVVDVSSGVVAQRMEYDEYGRVIEDTRPGFQPFGFVGGLYEPKTGLVRFGARDYDATTGRWTTKDPLGLAAGPTNLYEYVSGRPLDMTDPAGLCPQQQRRCRKGAMSPNPQNFWKDEKLRKMTERLYRESQGDGRERGAYLFRSPRGGISFGPVFVGAPYAGNPGNMGIPPVNAIAEFHTHPRIAPGYPLNSGGDPSPADYSRAHGNRIPSFVRGGKGLYGLDCDPATADGLIPLDP